MDKKQIINILSLDKNDNRLNSQTYMLMGISNNIENNKMRISKMSKANIIEYENGDTILFERAEW